MDYVSTCVGAQSESTKGYGSLLYSACSACVHNNVDNVSDVIHLLWRPEKMQGSKPNQDSLPIIIILKFKCNYHIQSHHRVHSNWDNINETIFHIHHSLSKLGSYLWFSLWCTGKHYNSCPLQGNLHAGISSEPKSHRRNLTINTEELASRPYIIIPVLS